MRRSLLLLTATALAGTPAGAADPPKNAVPDGLAGTWQHGWIDFEVWENYPERKYAGRNATPMREAMVIHKDGRAKYYRYEFAFGLYEELVDCEGKVTFHGDGTFTFTPSKGRKRFIDTRNPTNTKDRPLTEAELKNPKWAGTRRYEHDPAADPDALTIKVPTSAAYKWYRRK